MAITATFNCKLNPFLTRGPRDPLGYWFAVATATGDASAGNVQLEINLHQALAFSVEHISLDTTGITAQLYDLIVDSQERDGAFDSGRTFSGSLDLGVTQACLPAGLVLPYPRAVFRPSPEGTPGITAILVNVLARVYFLRARGLCWPAEAYRAGGPLFPGDAYPLTTPL